MSKDLYIEGAHVGAIHVSYCLHPAWGVDISIKSDKVPSDMALEEAIAAIRALRDKVNRERLPLLFPEVP